VKKISTSFLSEAGEWHGPRPPHILLGATFPPILNFVRTTIVTFMRSSVQRRYIGCSLRRDCGGLIKHCIKLLKHAEKS